MLETTQLEMFSQGLNQCRVTTSYTRWVGIPFGMPAENAARENNLHPKDWTEKNISIMKNQLKNWVYLLIGIEKYQLVLRDYYKHQQLFFIELYKKGLVTEKNYVNWDPVDETVLANEQVIDGKGGDQGLSLKEKN